MKPIDCVVIPARGGSKRILHKNMQPFLGIPMLERSIHLAKEISNFVIVSSDDTNILEFAKKLDVYSFKREAILSDDFTPTLPVVINALMPFLDNETLNFIGKTNNNKADIIAHKISLNSSILCLYATAVFATKELVLKSFDILKSNKEVAYIISTIDNKKVFRSFTTNENGFIDFIFKEYINTRSQDLKQAFCDAGQFYLGYAKSFLSEIPMLGEKSISMPLEYAWDIDTPLDLIIAQSIFKNMEQ